MAKIKLTKEEVQRILKIKGNVSGMIFNAFHQYVLEIKGKEGVASIESRLKELGFPLDFRKYSSFRMYPESNACLICLAILEYFDWDEEKAFDIGYEAPLYSLFTKVLMKYVSVERLIIEGPKHWKRYYDIAEIRCTEYDLKNGIAVMRLDGFKKFHPVVYNYIKGYLTKLIEIATKTKKVTTTQTKSLYNNDAYDEFKICWGNS